MCAEEKSPLEGAYSLRLSIAGYGNNLWWIHNFSGGRASAFRASAHLRSDLNSSSDLQFCAMAYYADGSTDLNCTPVSGAAGDKGTVNIALTVMAVSVDLGVPSLWAFAQDIGGRFVFVMDNDADSATQKAAQQLCESFSDIVELRRGSKAGITLVRPDGYIAYAAKGRDGLSALASLRSILERQTDDSPPIS